MLGYEANRKAQLPLHTTAFSQPRHRAKVPLADRVLPRRIRTIVVVRAKPLGEPNLVYARHCRWPKSIVDTTFRRDKI